MRVRIFEYGLWFLVCVEFVVPFTLIVIGCAFHQLSKDDVAFFSHSLPLVLLGVLLLTIAMIDLYSKKPRDLSPGASFCVDIRNEDFQRLSHFIERVSSASSVLISPQLVVFTGETNISVGLRFPNGPLRKGIVVLNIGKPLMDSLSLVEFEAVLVHELAHKLLNKEFRIYSWLFDRSRIRLLNKIGWIIFPVRRVLRQKYLREFAIDSEKRRSEELMCDCVSIRIVGEVGFAMALVSSYRVKHAVSSYLPSLLLQSVRESRLVWGDYIHKVDELVRRRLDRNEYLPPEFESASHPSLSERLSQTSLSPEECGRKSIQVDACASFRLLESASDSVDHYLDQVFKVNAKRCWEEWHDYVNSSPLDDSVLLGQVNDALAW